MPVFFSAPPFLHTACLKAALKTTLYEPAQLVKTNRPGLGAFDLEFRVTIGQKPGGYCGIGNARQDELFVIRPVENVHVERVPFYGRPSKEGQEPERAGSRAIDCLAVDLHPIAHGF